ncbi:MAG TPA: WecB/TagA/CpsF family glycosyltransferase [bacterium]|jgi:N-acetylglucosaminyldiphosphoundecaprenol N-acetyl-beta-D-mannosaminyltransferase|nr:WecB/TagA/CpsF family glycosyltransferase [bacterium]
MIHNRALSGAPAGIATNANHKYRIHVEQNLPPVPKKHRVNRQYFPAKIARISFTFWDLNAVCETFFRWTHEDKPRMVSLVNPHSVMTTKQDPHFARALDSMDVNLPDGIGIIMAAKILGIRQRGRIAGPDLVAYVCKHGRKNKLRHYFYGGNEGVAEAMASNLQKRFPGMIVAGTHCPPFRENEASEDRQILDKMNGQKIDVLWVGLGAPKQELWMAKHRQLLNAKILIGVGAAFDIHANVVKRSPKIFQKLGFEWLWRLILEPKRMWRRNLNSFYFLKEVMGQKFAFK